MSVVEFESGMLARSKAGHDKGHVYVILKTAEPAKETINARIQIKTNIALPFFFTLLIKYSLQTSCRQA